MPKFIVTPDMGTALKSLRMQRNIKAITVAKKIGKTGAFISKLENATLNTVDREDFINIIRALSNNEDEFNEAIDLLLKDAPVKYSKAESEEEEWSLNLDYFYRKISIPNSYRKLVQEKINALGISLTDLTNYINSNADLYNDESYSNELLDKAEKNYWHFNNGHSFIVVDVDQDTIEKIIYSDEVLSANYSILVCILISLLRLEKHSQDDAYREAHKILADLKIQTLSEKEAIMQAYDQENTMHNILDQKDNEYLPEEDRQMLTALCDFVSKITSFAQIHSVNYANKKISVMLENLIKDPILFMGYIGVDLSKLKDCDFEIKKEFVSAVSKLVDEYSMKKPDEEKQELI